MTQVVGAVLTLVVVALFWTGVPLLDQLEFKTYDMRLRALPRAESRHVTIAAIDEQSLAKLGRWPWSRRVFADLVARLDALGAKVIAFDIFFPEAESAEADGRLAGALKTTSKVVLGTVFLLDREEVRHLGAERLERAALAIGPQAIEDVRAPAPGLALPLPEPHGVIANLQPLQASAAFTGHINVLPDADGVVRRTPLVLRYQGRYFPAFDVQVARAYLGAPVSLELAEYGIAGLSVGARRIPLDEDGRLLVRYVGPERSFARVPIADILEGKADAALLRERIVLVGNTAHGIGDVRVTPLAGVFPGVEVRANIIHGLLEGEPLQRPEWMQLVDAAALLVVGLVLVLLLPRLGVLAGGLVALTALAGWLVLAVGLFRSEGLWLNTVYPTLLIALLFVAAALVRYFFAFSEKRYLKVAFQHYVPAAVVDDLVSDSARLRLGGEKRELTILFSDIRGFTTLSEAMQPEQLVELMNEYFTAMTDEVFAHRGTLDKYIGDAIMALYGAPVAEPQHALHACRTALAMIGVIDRLRGRWQPRGLPAVDIGVGINTGPVIVGNMGSASRFSYTAVGDAVNLASRVESLNKTYGTAILVSEHTYALVRDEFPLSREVDRVRVRGRSQPVGLYELMAPARYPSVDWLDAYRDAYREMREGDRSRAAELFAAPRLAADPVSAFHAKSCRYPARRQADA